MIAVKGVVLVLLDHKILLLLLQFLLQKVDQIFVTFREIVKAGCLDVSALANSAAQKTDWETAFVTSLLLHRVFTLS